MRSPVTVLVMTRLLERHVRASRCARAARRCGGRCCRSRVGEPLDVALADRGDGGGACRRRTIAAERVARLRGGPGTTGSAHRASAWRSGNRSECRAAVCGRLPCATQPCGMRAHGVPDMHVWPARPRRCVAAHALRRPGAEASARAATRHSAPMRASVTGRAAARRRAIARSIVRVTGPLARARDRDAPLERRQARVRVPVLTYELRHDVAIGARSSSSAARPRAGGCSVACDDARARSARSRERASQHRRDARSAPRCARARSLSDAVFTHAFIRRLMPAISSTQRRRRRAPAP